MRTQSNVNIDEMQNMPWPDWANNSVIAKPQAYNFFEELR
jgi:hypothetical protein